MKAVGIVAMLLLTSCTAQFQTSNGTRIVYIESPFTCPDYNLCPVWITR